MKVLYIVTCEIPSTDQVAEPLVVINPRALCSSCRLPYFAGEVRVVVEPQATEVLRWLDGDAEVLR